MFLLTVICKHLLIVLNFGLHKFVQASVTMESLGVLVTEIQLTEECISFLFIGRMVSHITLTIFRSFFKTLLLDYILIIVIFFLNVFLCLIIKGFSSLIISFRFLLRWSLCNLWKEYFVIFQESELKKPWLLGIWRGSCIMCWFGFLLSEAILAGFWCKAIQSYFVWRATLYQTVLVHIILINWL